MDGSPTESDVELIQPKLLFDITTRVDELLELMANRPTPDATIVAADRAVSDALRGQVVRGLRRTPPPSFPVAPSAPVQAVPPATPSVDVSPSSVRLSTASPVVELESIQKAIDLFSQGTRSTELKLFEIQAARAALTAVELQLTGVRNALKARQELQTLLQKLAIDPQQSRKPTRSLRIVQTLYRSIYGTELIPNTDQIQRAMAANRIEIAHEWAKKQPLLVQRRKLMDSVDRSGSIESTIIAQRNEMTALKSRIAMVPIATKVPEPAIITITPSIPVIPTAPELPTAPVSATASPLETFSELKRLHDDVNQWIDWAQTSPYFWVSSDTIRWRAMLTDTRLHTTMFRDQWMPTSGPDEPVDSDTLSDEKAAVSQWRLLRHAVETDVRHVQDQHASQMRQLHQLTTETATLTQLLDSLNQGVKKKIDTTIDDSAVTP